MIYETVIYNVFLIFMCLLVIDTILIGVLKRLIIYMATISDKINLNNLNFASSKFNKAKVNIKG